MPRRGNPFSTTGTEAHPYILPSIPLHLLLCLLRLRRLLLPLALPSLPPFTVEIVRARCAAPCALSRPAFSCACSQSRALLIPPRPASAPPTGRARILLRHGVRSGRGTR
ncbi:unnamed protein product [Closterium sp. NIES-54]